MMFSRKTRAAGAALLMASMALAGTAFGQQGSDRVEITPDNPGAWDSLTSTQGDLLINRGVQLVLSGKTITVGDDFVIIGSDTTGAKKSKITVGSGGTLQAISDGSLERGGELVLEDDAKVNVGGDFEISSGTLTLNEATISTNMLIDNNGVVDGNGSGFNIGWYDDTTEKGPARVIVKSGKSATMKADGFFAIKKDAEVRLEPDSKLAIGLHKATASSSSDADILAAKQKSGAFVLGSIVKPINFDDPAYAELNNVGNNWVGADSDLPSGGYLAEAPGTVNGGYGGLLHLGANSQATITGRAIFGAVIGGDLNNGNAINAAIKSESNLGLKLDEGSYLKVDGNAWFLENSMLTLHGDGAENKNIVHATGTITIERNALVNVIDGKEGDVIFKTDTGFNGLFAPLNPAFMFVARNNMIYIGSYRDDIAENVIGSVGLGGNYRAGGGLIQGALDSAAMPAEIKVKLANNLQAIAFADRGLAETALKQLIGEEALAATGAAQSSLSQGNQALGKHFQSLRGGNMPSAGAGDTENRLWLGGFGQWSSQDDADNVYGYDYNAVGVMLGYDREIAALPGLTLGLNGSWNSGTVENNDGLAETDIDSFGLGIYGLYEFSNGFFIEGDLGYGHAKNDSQIKLALGGKKTGDFDIDSFQAGLNLGYDYTFEGGATLTPSAGLRYTRIKQNGWTERIVSDPENMAVANWFDDSTQNVLEIPVNLKLAKTFEKGGGYAITPELRVGAVFTATEPDSSLRMGFVGSNDSIAIYGIDPGRSRFTAGAGIKAQLNDTVDLFAGYDLEARRGYMGHSASLGLGFSF